VAGEASSAISVLAVSSFHFDDTNVNREVESVGNHSLNPSLEFQVDNLLPGTFWKMIRINFETPSGFVATVDLQYIAFATGCELTGTAIAG
jgi:hypothetical protein